MSLSYVLSPADYNEFFGPATYPCSTQDVVNQLRQRGLLTDVDCLESIWEKVPPRPLSEFPHPLTDASGKLHWLGKDVEAAAVVLEDVGHRMPYTAQGAMRLYLGLNPGQHEQALREGLDIAQKENPAATTNDLELRIYPQGYGFPAGHPDNDPAYKCWPYSLAIYVYNRDFLKARAEMVKRCQARRAKGA